ncbi:MAG: toprim domain-containing protein [Bacillota bacterium]
MPMKIDKDKLEEWIDFTFDKYKRYKNDFLVNSCFKEDNKFKLSISPEKQCYHCWKTNFSGPLWKLVCIIEKCSKQEALELIYDKPSLKNFDNSIKQLQDKAKKIIQQPEISLSSKSINYPKDSYLLSIEDKNPINIKALKYCINRKVNPFKWKFRYCDSGPYSGYMIMPFFDKNEKLIYWIARSLLNHSIKYKNPPAESDKDIKKEELIFTSNWEFKEKDIFVTEGVFDAISLIELGFHAISIQGKTLSLKQLEIIKEGNLIFAFDNDKAGKEAYLWNMDFLKENGYTKPIKYIIPPLENQDWNSCFVLLKEKLKDYINNNVKNFSFYQEINLLLNK